MTAVSDEDYGRRERLLQQSTPVAASSSQHPAYPVVACPPTAVPQATPQFPPGERYGTNSERFPTSAERFPNSTERFTQSNGTTDRYTQSTGTTDRYTQASGPGERFPQSSTNGDRFVPQSTTSGERFCQAVANGDRFVPQSTPVDRFPPSNVPTERYIQGTSTPERYHTPTPSQDRYIQSSTPGVDRFPPQSGTDRYIASTVPTPERYTPTESRYANTSDRYPPTNPERERYVSSTQDRYIGQNGECYPSGERYIPPPAPSSGERYLNGSQNAVERFAKSPVPNERYQNGDRYIQDRYHSPNYLQASDRYPPPPAPNERYIPNQNSDRYPSFLPPSPNYLPNSFVPPTTPVNPGDPYMRRDLGYHHHYRLPHPNYHAHHHYHHYHRALPPAPHHRYHQHVMPSPNRNHLRCCASPNHINNALTAVNSTSSQTTQPQQPSSAPVTVSGTPNSGSREYLNASPSMTRGRTTPQRNSIVEFGTRNNNANDFSATMQRGVNVTPALDFGGATRGVDFSARGPPIVTTPVEYVGASGGRHVSTPPPTMLPRCASMSNCDVGIENPMCGHRRGCLDTLDGSTVSLCCGSARRYAGQVNMEKVTAEGIKNGCVTTPSHVAVQHTPHHSSVWRAVGQQATPQASPQASPPGSTPVVGTSPTATPSSPNLDSNPDPTPSTASPSTASPSSSHQGSSTISHHGATGLPHHLERSVSMPAPSPTPNPAPPRPRLQRSMSRTEVVKNFIRRETAVFFGLEESSEKEEQALWLERRKRLANRKYGELREEYAQRAIPPSQQPSQTSAYTHQQSRDSRPDVLPVGRDSTDLGREGVTSPRWTEPPVRRKESVARMTFGGVAYLVTTLTRHRPRPTPQCRKYSRSFPLAAVPEASSLVEASEEVFFDRLVPAQAVATPAMAAIALSAPPAYSDTAMRGAVGDTVDSASAVEEAVDAGFTSSREQLEQPASREQYIARRHHRTAGGWRRPPERLESVSESGPEVGCSRIWTRVLDRVFDNSDRRQYGMGFVGRFFGRSMKRSVASRGSVREQLDDIEDYRPFFTYWITTVQVLVLFISLFCYGLGPVGFDLNNRAGEVLVTSLSLQQVEYQEPANFWLGPRAGDLIHLGAKFAPCMRKDAKIIKEIEKGREKERETACCIRNDDSGCVQSSLADCSKTISTWKKWSSGDSGPGGRISGSVCGLDPKFCEAPASVAPYEWPDDITKWPICRKTKPQNFRPRDKIAEHMVCEVIGHPCCIGIHGMCRITTKEYCDFVRGYFHEEASLCSQVSCLDDVCGMIPFYSPEVPDQFYRLWTSLFLHAGVGHLIITLGIQFFLMRDLEKLTGPLRIGIIYMGSGVAGNLASAIFVPYRAEVGPAGAQFGLLACLIVEVLNVWPMLKHPEHALLKLLSTLLVLFLFGLLPWVDNYAHLFGFVFGFLLSYALMPFVSFGQYDRHKKYALIWVCLLSAMFLFCALVVLFYVIPVYDCEVCNYFTCLPLTRDFCASQNINFKREEPVV